ncbi:alpha/beta hydrolase [Rubellimicrobium rubrum]|uniref:Alpha/beta hydrolase n=1 Tax=Rubellimicrobium rubrum TaxID=2585369 RepID=A0A5C4MY77_9RHOB|nr:alpha/beta hydrolase [Rubellimicrobium rubrum]TNC50427.1 alpha/beta hydrolase [Rubellimicrobium rubrum]
MAASFFRDGLDLAVHAVGGGRPMLFEHGLCGDADQTAAVFPDRSGWQGVTVECRGHGRSGLGPSEAVSLATFADDLAGFIEARLPAPVVVGGISMGAALALRLAIKRPELVSGLVLARPAWLYDPAPPDMQPYRLVGGLLARLPPDEALAEFEASDTARRLAAEAPDNLASLRGFFRRKPAAATAILLNRIAADGPGVTVSEVAAVSVPTLVIGHGQDSVHPMSHAEALAAQIPGARLGVITPKATNHDRYRAEFSAALDHFLEEIPA